MACWSAENATNAYLRALKMGKRGKEPDVVEFISAVAAGNNAQVMVIVSASIAGSLTISLVAAAHQTGGRVVCILPTLSCFYASKIALGPYADCVKYVIGDAKTLLLSDYKEADFVLIDCNIHDHKRVFKAAQGCSSQNGRGVVVGYNAVHKGPWSSEFRSSEFKTQYLPIGEGLVVSKIGRVGKAGGGHRKRSRWVVTVDKCTGEENVYRITCPWQEIEAA